MFGLATYLSALPEAFGRDIDHAMLLKMFGEDDSKDTERKYRPGCINGARKTRVIGSPNHAKVPTSYRERLNLTTGMSMERFTRPTSEFSTQPYNLQCAIALHFTQYNSGRKHQTLRTTPGVAAGLADKIWTLQELVGLLER